MTRLRPASRLAAPLAALAFAAAFALARPGAPPAARLVPDCGGALAELVIHFPAAAAQLTGETYGDFFRALPAEARVTIAVPGERDFGLFREEMRRRGVPNLERFRPLFVEAPITAWARDRFLALAAGPGAKPAGVLLVPEDQPEAAGARLNDPLVPLGLARESGGRIAARRLAWRADGGDFACGEDFVVVSPHFARRNGALDAADRRELERLLAREFGRPCFILGEEAAALPDHHVGMYLAPLGEKTIAVGDVPLAAGLLRRAGQEELLRALGADLSAACCARFARAAEELARRGFRLVRLPLLPLADPRVFVTYTNHLAEERGGRKIVYLPAFDLPVLDQTAADILAAEGWTVRPVRVGRVFRERGTLGCLVGVVARAER